MRNRIITTMIILMAFLTVNIRAEKAGVRFDTDKDTLKPESFAILDETGADIMKYYKDDKDLKIKISGHTDWRATNAYNQNLSERRANTVKRYFMEKLGIPEVNFATVGMGEEMPIAPNNTDEGMALNRRVEIEYAGKKIILSSIVQDTPTPENTPTPTATETPMPSPTEEARANRLGFLAMTGGGLPMGPGSAKGTAWLEHMAGKIGAEMSFAKRFGITLEAAVYRLFDGGKFVTDFGQFALGGNYEFMDGTYRPFVGLKVFYAKISMKNSDYTFGGGIDAGMKFFFNEYFAGVAAVEYLGMINSLNTVNVNIGVEVYTYRDNNWGWQYNKPEYKPTPNRDPALLGDFAAKPGQTPELTPEPPQAATVTNSPTPAATATWTATAVVTAAANATWAGTALPSATATATPPATGGAK